jgi:hypothetical protein
MVAAETPYKRVMIGSLMKALFGDKSKFANAS